MQKLSSLLNSWRSERILFITIPLVVAADQLSKLWIRHRLLVGQYLPEEGMLRLTHRENDGIIFGLPAHQIVTLILPIIVVIVALSLYYYRHDLFNSRLTKIGLGLVVGGSIGNLIDRFRLGHVTDFIDLRLWDDVHWPAFNLADSALVIGVILFIFFLLRMVKPSGIVNGN